MSQPSVMWHVIQKIFKWFTDHSDNYSYCRNKCFNYWQTFQSLPPCSRWRTYDIAHEGLIIGRSSDTRQANWADDIKVTLSKEITWLMYCAHVCALNCNDSPFRHFTWQPSCQAEPYDFVDKIYLSITFAPAWRAADPLLLLVRFPLFLRWLMLLLCARV